MLNTKEVKMKKEVNISVFQHFPLKGYEVLFQYRAEVTVKITEAQIQKIVGGLLKKIPISGFTHKLFYIEMNSNFQVIGRGYSISDNIFELTELIEISNQKISKYVQLQKTQ